MHLFELIEAEGRSLRAAAARFGLGLSLTIVSAALVLVACVGFLAGIWLGLNPSLGPAGASAITGALSLLLAGGLLAISLRLTK